MSGLGQTPTTGGRLSGGSATGSSTGAPGTTVPTHAPTRGFNPARTLIPTLYGEPAYHYRPYVNRLGEELMSSPSPTTSYEETRLKAGEQRGDFRIVGDLRKMNIQGDEKAELPYSSLVKRQTAFLDWSQSPMVEVLVGPDEKPFRLPGDFLTRRSLPIRVMLEDHFKESSTRVIRLPETDLDTFHNVATWMMSSQPSLHHALPLSVAVRIAVFATVYMVPSLLHQTLDLLRVQLSRPEAVLTPEILDNIYDHADEHSLLRRLSRAALPILDRSCDKSNVKGGQNLSVWQKVFEDHPELGFDYFVSKRKDRHPEDLVKGDACRFHFHAGGSVWSGCHAWNTCKERDDECFEEVQANTAMGTQRLIADEDSEAGESAFPWFVKGSGIQELEGRGKGS